MVERDKELKGQPGTAVLSIELIEQLKSEYNIDANRIYVLGHSMGGQGTWITLWDHPEYFAAAIPSAGAPFSPPDAELEALPYSRFKDVPIWAFHSDDDQTIDVENTRKIFKAMQDCGGNMKYTEFTGFGHSAHKVAFTHSSEDAAKFETQYSSDRVDETKDVWDWLFRQRK
jgi:predicted peptidase